jgi:glyoxylase-like metal-dependent hydrolase (beta-lactamase superfamily II)
MTLCKFLGRAAVLVLLTPLGASAQQPDFSKVEIKAEQLAPGVAVLVGAGGNIGVSFGPDGTLLIDDQFAPLTDKILAALAGIGAPSVKYLVNTHWHGDHTGGNENLGRMGVTIFAHDNVRVRLAAGNARTPAAAQVALPVVTYAGGLSFHLNGDRIDAFTSRGHTDGDTVLFWRKANVMHTGDLMMNGLGFPYIDIGSGGNAWHLVATLDQMLAIANAETKIIPGHGPVASKTDLQVWRDMIYGSIKTIVDARKGGQKDDQILAADPLKPLEKPGGFINSQAFTKAILASLDEMAHRKHAVGHQH